MKLDNSSLHTSRASLYKKRFVILLATANDLLCEEVSRYLEPYGYQIIRASDMLTAVEIADGRKGECDLVLCDVDLPPLSGYELCRALKHDARLRKIPVIMITRSYMDVEAKARALNVGADDLLYEPLHDVELRARVRASLRHRALAERLDREIRRLETLVRRRTKELEDITLGLVAALEKASSLNDTDTGLHIRRVSAYSELLADELGLEAEFVTKIARYASLHDVGKVGLPDSILKKVGKLTPQEYELMKQHTVLGYELLKAAHADPVACNIALYHHERYDGSGYPKGLSGDAIPLEARIVALADVYDAITTKRPYKEPQPPEVAARIIEEGSGTHFDPGIVFAFRKCRRKFERVFERLRDR